MEKNLASIFSYLQNKKIIFLIIYAACIAPIFLIPAYTFDEVWFSGIGQAARFKAKFLSFPIYLFFQENDLGYGAIYWILFSVLYKIPYVSAPYVMRIIVFALNIFIPYNLLSTKDEKENGILAFFIWFSMPIAWWAGKVIAPEAFLISAGVFICIRSFNQDDRKRWYWDYIIAGLCIGVKLTSLPLMIFFFLNDNLGKWRGFKNYIYKGLFLILGFILANPFFVTGPKAFVMNILTIVQKSEAPFTNIGRVISNDAWEWDLVYNGALVEWSFAPFALIFLLAFILINKPNIKLTLILLVTFLFTFLTVLTNLRFQGWYWFPFIAIIPIYFKFINIKYPLSTVLVLIAVLINIFSFGPRVKEEYTHRFTQYKVLQTRATVQKELTEKVKAYDDLTIIELSEIGMHLFKGSKYTVRYSGQAYLWLQSGFYSNPKTNKYAMIIIGPRIAEHHKHLRDLKKHVNSSIIPRSKYTRVLETGEVAGTRYVIFE